MKKTSQTLYSIHLGGYYADGGPTGINFKWKKDAEKYLRTRGFKYNKEQDLFLNESLREWGSIEKGTIYYHAF